MSQPHGSQGGHHHSEGPVRATLVSMYGAGADEHDVSPPGYDPQSLKAGHEPDRFAVRAILYVPALVVGTLVVTYVIITAIFSKIVREDARMDVAETTNPQVKAVNDRPINARFGAISSVTPVPVIPGEDDTKVRQPRLELLQQQGDPKDPPYLRSKRPLQIENNPPEIRPEYLRPENYIDPASGKHVLLAAEAVPGKDEKLARIPIEAAIKLAAESKGEKGILPVRKDPVKLAATSDGVAKFSNGGVPTVPAAPAEKHDDHGKKKDH